MFFIMILSGFLTTMNIWTDKLNDIRLSLNDVYMVLLMAGWMVLFMGLFYGELYPGLFGFILVSLCLFAIRTQFMINKKQFILGMIPHHSMAVFMSKKLIENEKIGNFQNFVKNIIVQQEKEIEFMKTLV